ncbi:hypothetical protein HA402_014842 [Bradysia odoriphaga]|nr:hypothetical protein HA402_014842 [Bradysia odoriphaga]
MFVFSAAQRLANNNAAPKTRVPDMPTTERGGYCGALQRAPPAMPAGLARRLANKDNFGMGKVKVMLRIADSQPDVANQHFMCIDKKKRQVTLTDPATAVSSTSTAASSQERGPMVAAPKMFAFDGLFTCDDTQADICSSALSEVIPAVLEGSDGCLLTLGYPQAGQSKTMFGSVSSAGDLGAIPCAISWLFKGINERRQKSGARFSVRVSALGVNATKPGSSSKDLLAAHKTESDESPSSYLRDDFLGGPTELRAPTAERAALFLDAALSGRHQGVLDPALIFTLHVYQYSLGGKGAVAGGRSRLHLIDLGGCANRNGGIPLSGIGNVLLAILSGQRHPPNRDHPLTPLLKDCLAPLTCHVSVLAHVSHRQVSYFIRQNSTFMTMCNVNFQNHTDALTTIQLASRIHRLRRRKHRFPLSSDNLKLNSNSGNQSGSSEGPDPSSSDLSADTVIYMGPSDDATDGEHPPVYLPSLSSGDNRCSMNKALKGSVVEKASKLPLKKTTTKRNAHLTESQSPVPAQRTDSLKRRTVSNSSPVPCDVPQQNISAYQYGCSQAAQNPGPMPNSPKMIAAAYRNVGINKGSNVPTPKGSPLRRPNTSNQGSPKRHVNSEEEQWVDGPRLSRSKVAEARHLLREINHVKQREQWIDGPKMSPAKTLVAGALPGSSTPGYGYMDSHKKIMIRQWVENQTSQIFQPSASSSPQHQSSHQATANLQLFRNPQPEFDRISTGSSSHIGDLVNPNSMPVVNTGENAIRVELKHSQDQCDEKSERSTSSALNKQNDSQEEEDQDSGPSEVPPALPLLEPLGSREISHDSLHMMCSRHVSRESLGIASHQSHQTHHTLASHQSHLIHVRDCGLQVTEDDIVKAMGDHPLSILSQGNVSVVSSFNNLGDAFGDCSNGDRTKHQFDQLARLREIYTSQLAMAEVVPAFRINDACSVFSEPAYRFIAGPGSVCSEPAYRPPSPRCSGCRQSIGLSRTPSQNSLPSLNGIVTIAGMEQYASLRHPDGASDPNLQQKSEQNSSVQNIDETTELLQKPPSIDLSEHKLLHSDTQMLATKHQLQQQQQQQQQLQQPQQQLPPLPLSTPEAYDSGHDSSTPRTSKHSGISRRAESGYHSVATVRDSDESSYGSEAYRGQQRITVKKRARQDKSLCNWLRNPFTCTYPDTEGEISDF